MEKLKGQAAKVSQLLFSTETSATYSKAIGRTWEILRETGILLWLVICLVFVGAEWFWYTAIRLGHQGRAWYEALQTPSPGGAKSASQIGQSLLLSLSSGTETLLYRAKQQLGIEAEPPVPKVVAAQSSPASTIASQPGTPPPPAKTTAAAAPSVAQGEAELPVPAPDADNDG